MNTLLVLDKLTYSLVARTKNTKYADLLESDDLTQEICVIALSHWDGCRLDDEQFKQLQDVVWNELQDKFISEERRRKRIEHRRCYDCILESPESWLLRKISDTDFRTIMRKELNTAEFKMLDALFGVTDGACVEEQSIPAYILEIRRDTGDTRSDDELLRDTLKKAIIIEEIRRNW